MKFAWILGFLFLPLISFALPPDCLEGCVVPFGEEIGRTRDDLPVYSNCSKKCASESRKYTYLANWPSPMVTYEWNSVEFLKRWLLNTFRVMVYTRQYHTFDKAEYRDDFVKVIPVDESIVKYYEVTNFENGKTKLPPQADDIVFSHIQAKDELDPSTIHTPERGHVSIIDQVDLHEPHTTSKVPTEENGFKERLVGTATLIEQNGPNLPWENSYSRKVDIIRDNNGYYSLGFGRTRASVWGWKRLPPEILKRRNKTR